MYKNIGKKFIYNNEIISNDKFIFELDSSNIIYEVIRVIDNKVVSLDGHMKRLKESMENFSIDLKVVELIKNNISELIEIHKDFNRNIKIDVYENEGKYDYRLYFVESVYPKAELYKAGVRTTASHIVRDHPHIKILNMDYKKKIQELKGKDYFEVLLVNDTGYITEGSRANLVFVKGNTLFITPLKDILVGITLKSVIGYIDELGCNIKYLSVHLDKISDYDACFLTGTSLGVLPINSIDETNFKSSTNPLVLDLIEAYNSDVGN